MDAAAAAAADCIVLFDFDCTIIDVDSDPWVAEQLGLLPVFDELRAQMPWNDMMEAFLGVAQASGRSREEMIEALRSAPMQPSKISAIRAAHALGCELRIISDANVFFIRTILDKYDVTQMFSEIHTNPIYVDDRDRLHIQPFHPKSAAPHGCPNCPPNMCKGRIIDEIISRATKESKRIIYLGDGCGDYCPSLRLRHGDSVLPRKGYPLLELISKTKESAIRASVHPWGSGEEMEETLLRLISARKPMAAADQITDHHAAAAAAAAGTVVVGSSAAPIHGVDYSSVISAFDPATEVLAVTRVTA